MVLLYTVCYYIVETKRKEVFMMIKALILAAAAAAVAASVTSAHSSYSAKKAVRRYPVEENRSYEAYAADESAATDCDMDYMYI